MSEEINAEFATKIYDRVQKTMREAYEIGSASEAVAFLGCLANEIDSLFVKVRMRERGENFETAMLELMKIRREAVKAKIVEEKK